MRIRSGSSVPKPDPTEEELNESDRILDELHKKHGDIYD